ncbi:hypothetical protein EUX98_g9804, partial [Antrodiella citrinella]
ENLEQSPDLDTSARMSPAPLVMSAPMSAPVPSTRAVAPPFLAVTAGIPPLLATVAHASTPAVLVPSTRARAESDTSDRGASTSRQRLDMETLQVVSPANQPFQDGGLTASTQSSLPRPGLPSWLLGTRSPFSS